MAAARPNLPPVPKIPAEQRHKCTKSWVEAVSLFSTGTTFDADYEITDVEALGSGHCGEVFTCKSKQTSEKRAVKCSNKNADRVKLLLTNELCIVHRIGSHPNFFKCFGVYENWDTIFIVMELGARSLKEAFNKDFVNEDKHIHVDIMSELTREFLDALCHLHHLGIAHRDLKLSNIVCRSMSSVIPIALIDFDLSFMAEEGHEVIMDTPCGNLMTYAPETIRRLMDRMIENRPELLRGLPYGQYGRPAQSNFTTDTKIDVYGFGACMFHLCTTFSPFGTLERVDACPKHGNVMNRSCFMCLDRILRAQTHLRIFTYPQVSGPILRYGERMMKLIKDSLIFDAQSRPKAIDLYQSCSWIQNATQQALVEHALEMASSAQVFRSRTLDVVSFGACQNPQTSTEPEAQQSGGIPAYKVPVVLHNIEMQGVPNRKPDSKFYEPDGDTP